MQLHVTKLTELRSCLVTIAPRQDGLHIYTTAHPLDDKDDAAHSITLSDTIQLPDTLYDYWQEVKTYLKHLVAPEILLRWGSPAAEASVKSRPVSWGLNMVGSYVRVPPSSQAQQAAGPNWRLDPFSAKTSARISMFSRLLEVPDHFY